MLLTLFDQIPDHRRPQGRTYELKYVLFFSVLALLCGADSYRSIASSIRSHFGMYKQVFHLSWRTPPAYSTIRYALSGVDSTALETAFRTHARGLASDATHHISMDGKMIRGSFDHIAGQHPLQVLMAYLTEPQIILAHVEMNDGEKEHEIDAVRTLLTKLDLPAGLLTLDALHCQKKRLKRRGAQDS